jgi:hypothetical protein
MNREVHVRFCEGLGVKFPGPTRQNRPWRPIGGPAEWQVIGSQPTIEADPERTYTLAAAPSQSGLFRLGSGAPLVPIDAPLPWVPNEL